MTGQPEEHERIWLQDRADEDPDLGRMWCQDNVWSSDLNPTEYVRADLYDTLRAELDQCAVDLEEAAKVFKGRGFLGLASIYRSASQRARAALTSGGDK